MTAMDNPLTRGSASPPQDLTEGGNLPAPIAAFDAGDMGCANGLVVAFRRQVQRVEVGQVIEVTLRDPSAKVDLPSLARMMGHRIRSMSEVEDGAVVVQIERGR
jgi:TusA-related sulfurtransferase